MTRIDWTKWSAIAEILSAFVIVATLLYLADQTRELRIQTEQNNLLMRSQTRSEISQSISDILLREAHSEYIGDVMSPEITREIPEQRFLTAALAMLRIWENVHYQWRSGLYEDSEYEAEKQIWAININDASRKRIYCEFRDAMAPQFRAEIDSLLEKPC